MFYAEAAMALPLPRREEPSVDEGLYKFGLRHTFAAAASWSGDPKIRERGRKVCDWLALSRDTPGYIRSPARYNSGWYAVPAHSLLPSFQLHPLSIPVPRGLHAMNIGVCRSEDQLIAIASAIDWTIVNGPRECNWAYLSGHTSGMVELVYLEIDRDLNIMSSADVRQPDDMPPPESREDIGFGDPRPFIWRKELWCICPIRRLNAEAIAEMALVRIDRTQPDRYVLADWRVVPSGMSRRWEKNWMPQADGDELRLIYSVDPTRVLSDTGVVLHNEIAPVVSETFRGGSQAVAFDRGWLMIIHEHEHVNGKRRYFHRFIWMDAANTLQRPFPPLLPQPRWHRICYWVGLAPVPAGLCPRAIPYLSQ